MEEFLGKDLTENIVTPESLALKLLINDDIDNYSGVLQTFVTGDDNKNTTYDRMSGQFEILITIYMEMIFGLLKIDHINSYMNDNNELTEDIDFVKTFNPELTKYNADDLTKIFKEKFAKIRFFMSVHEIDDNTNDFGYYNKHYCKIILKDTPEGKTYFWRNRQRLDPEKRYTFVTRSDKEKTYKKLEDFYAVCALPHMKIRISFSPINIIVKDPHII